jgi:PAS domain S-box-containing protein
VFKNYSIGTKIHIPVIVMMLLGVAVIAYNGIQSLEETSKNAHDNFASNMQTYIKQGLHEKEQIGLTNAINIANNNNISNALKQNKRHLAIQNLKVISNSFKKNSDYKNIKIHIHDVNIHSFLRNWNLDKYGDDLKGFRQSIIRVKQIKEPFITVESGRAGMLLRGLSPIIDKGEYLGSVEFIQGFNSLVKKAVSEKNYDMVFLACSHDEDIKRFDKNSYKVGNLFLSQKKEISNKELLNTLQTIPPEQLTKDKFIIKDNFFITSVPILNHDKEKVGCGIIATHISNVNIFVDEATKSLLNQIFLIVFLDVVLLLFLLFFLHLLIKKPVDHLIKAIKSIEKSLTNKNLKDLYAENKLTINNYDEIGAISKTINVLLKNMSTTFVELQKSNKSSSEYMKAVDAGSIVSKSNPEGIITYVNETLCKKTGYSKEELIGKPHNIFKHPNTPKNTFKKLWKTIQAGEIYHGLFKNTKKDGTTFYANITIVPIKDDSDNIVEYVALRDDVTELVNSKKELKKNFLTDPLTSLGNRFKLLEDSELNKHVYLAIVDIQSFKEINDFYGHKFGDSVIRGIANRLFNFFSDNKFEVYRLNGDEFGILADSSKIDKKLFFELVNDFITLTKQNSFIIDDNNVSIQLTCGLSYNGDHLFHEADIAHKYAKKSNKDIIEYSDRINTDEAYKKNLEWTNEIKEAIDNNRIEAFYQPIVNTSNNKIEKYETLMRLIKSDGTEVSPFFFLDIAKKTRLYKELTKIIVTKAFQKFSGTQYEFSINLSAEDIMLHDVSDWLFELACDYKVNNQVVIELVESEGIESFDTMDTFIKNAKENGMKIAIDDFGTGYSNFEYLIKLNTDFLKIDGSLIKEIDTDEKIYSVVETIVAFANKNNIKTIAEFIANESLYEKIKELGIDYGQGFYLGKPNPKINLPLN